MFPVDLSESREVKLNKKNKTTKYQGKIEIVAHSKTIEEALSANVITF
jgi:hypothetical protein